MFIYQINKNYDKNIKCLERNQRETYILVDNMLLFISET